MRGIPKLIQVTLTGDTAAYSSADVIDSPTALAEAVADDGGYALIDSICVRSKTATNIPCDIYFFDRAPANSVGANNAALAINDADLQYLLGRVSLASTDFSTASATNAEGTKSNIQLLVRAKAGARSIYIVVVARGAITLGVATDLSVVVGLRQY